MCKQIVSAVMLCVFSLLQANIAYAVMTHSAADHGVQGFIIESIGVVIVVGVLGYTIKCFIWPGEKDKRHIKRQILRDRW